MEFVDLKEQYINLEQSINSRIKNVLSHGKYIMGPEIYELEEALALYVGVNECISVSSGTDALLISLMALGVGRGDEVITTPFSFIATGEAIAMLGAKPIFVDINPKTYNIDERLIEDAISKKTKAIMPVSLFGQCAELNSINRISEKYGLPVIEDAAQSFGATHHDRRSAGLSTIGCTSFFPSKPLGGYGDGGACFTNDESIAKSIREIRSHGQERRYHHVKVGVNGRMDTLQAAILLAKMEVFPEEVKMRKKVGDYYTELFSREANGKVGVPYISDNNSCVYAQYTIRVRNREVVSVKLAEKNIPTAVHYPVPLHCQPVFSGNGYGDYGSSEEASKMVLSLPMHPYLTRQDQEKVVSSLLNVLTE